LGVKTKVFDLDERVTLERGGLFLYIGSAGSTVQECAMLKKADQRILLVIDVQNDFCPGGSLAVDAGDQVIPVINALMPLFSRVVATQDWHPADHVSFASCHPGKKVLDSVDVEGVRQVLWPDHCVQGTPGAELHPRLDARGIGLVLRKGMRRTLDSYSAFFENDKSTETGLAQYLTGLKVREIVLCGLATDYCVLASAVDARRLGFDVTLVRDACRGVDFPKGSVDAALKDMKKAGVKVVESKALE
jgi:nicotinamidase/pyrazinamidase